MNINDIIYQTTRGIYSVEDKLSIATVILFCHKSGAKELAELLYTEYPELFIDHLNAKYADYGVDFSIRLSDKNIRDAFDKTIASVREKYDSDGYLKALYNNDPFALAIAEIVSSNFSGNAQK
jgi:hypothetical protein